MKVGLRIAIAWLVFLSGFSAAELSFAKTNDKASAWLQRVKGSEVFGLSIKHLHLGEQLLVLHANPPMVVASAPKADFQFPTKSLGTLDDIGYMQPFYGTNLFSTIDEPQMILSKASVGSNAGSRAGFTFAAAGDIDFDGADEFIYGEPGYNSSTSGKKAGRAKVFTLVPSATPLVYNGLAYELIGEGKGDQFGYSVEGVGDVNGDGVPDFAIGAPGRDSTKVDSGRVTIYSGNDLTKIIDIDGWFNGQGLGQTITVVRNSGTRNVVLLVIGAQKSLKADYLENKNSLHVYNLQGVLLYSIYDVAGKKNSIDFGAEVHSLVDLNNDGLDDLLVSVPSAAGGRGKITALTLAASGASEKFKLLGSGSKQNFGSSIDRLESHDDSLDLLVGAPGHSQGSGAVYFVSLLTDEAGHVYGADTRGRLLPTKKKKAKKKGNGKNSSKGGRFGEAVVAYPSLQSASEDIYQIIASAPNHNHGEGILYFYEFDDLPCDGEDEIIENSNATYMGEIVKVGCVGILTGATLELKTLDYEAKLFASSKISKNSSVMPSESPCYWHLKGAVEELDIAESLAAGDRSISFSHDDLFGIGENQKDVVNLQLQLYRDGTLAGCSAAMQVQRKQHPFVQTPGVE